MMTCIGVVAYGGLAGAEDDLHICTATGAAARRRSLFRGLLFERGAVHLLGGTGRLAVRGGAFGQVRVVMDEVPDDGLAVLRVPGGVENVLVPEVVEILRPRHDGFARVARNEVKELAVLLLDAIRAVPDLPPPPLPGGEFRLDAAQIKCPDAFPFRVHDRLPGS